MLVFFLREMVLDEFRKISFYDFISSTTNSPLPWACTKKREEGERKFQLRWYSGQEYNFFLEVWMKKKRLEGIFVFQPPPPPALSPRAPTGDQPEPLFDAKTSPNRVSKTFWKRHSLLYKGQKHLIWVFFLANLDTLYLSARCPLLFLSRCEELKRKKRKNV